LSAAYSVKRDGTILTKPGGQPLGFVFQVDAAFRRLGRWRAEVGDPAEPETYRVVYAPTRREAVEEALAR
jgi:hypothetical protein